MPGFSPLTPYWISISRLHVYIRVPRQGITEVIALARSCYVDPRPFQFVRPDFLHDRTRIRPSRTPSSTSIRHDVYYNDPR